MQQLLLLWDALPNASAHNTKLYLWQAVAKDNLQLGNLATAAAAAATATDLRFADLQQDNFAVQQMRV